MTDIKVHLMEELKDEVPSTIHFDVGYYEKCSSKWWLVTIEDLAEMYSGAEMLLWCDGRRKKRDGGTSSKLDEDVDEHYKTLMEKHGDSSSEKVMGTNTSLWDS